MSCNRAPTSSRSGRETLRVYLEAATAVSTRCRSTVYLCTGLRCGAERTTSQPGISREIRFAWSKDSQAGTAARPAPSRLTRFSRACRGQGTGKGADSCARRSTVCGEIRSPACAAAAAVRSTSTGSRSGRASAAKTTSESCTTTPSARGERSEARPILRKRGSDLRLTCRRTRPQATELTKEMVRPAAQTARNNSSSSVYPSIAATCGCSCWVRRSVVRPVLKCRASRASSSVRRAMLNEFCGGLMIQLAAKARITVRSRRPP